MADKFAREPGPDPLIVNGIAVHPPLTEQQAQRIASIGLLADDRDGLNAAWRLVEEMWQATIARARELPSEGLDEQVNGEWSFLQTLRHLVFVTDAWIGDVVCEDAGAYHPLGVAPHFVANGRELGLDLHAKPTIDEVLSARDERMRRMRDLIAQATPEELSRRCTPRGGRFTVLGAVQVTIFEEWAHNQFASRDLKTLETAAESS